MTWLLESELATSGVSATQACHCCVVLARQSCVDLQLLIAIEKQARLSAAARCFIMAVPALHAAGADQLR